MLLLNNIHYLRGISDKIMIEEMRILREECNTVTVFSRGHEKNYPQRFAAFMPLSIMSGW
jgi:hypothetical protein